MEFKPKSPSIKGDATAPPKTGLQGGTYIVSMTGLDGQVIKPSVTGGAPSVVGAKSGEG